MEWKIFAVCTSGRLQGQDLKNPEMCVRKN